MAKIYLNNSIMYVNKIIGISFLCILTSFSSCTPSVNPQAYDQQLKKRGRMITECKCLEGPTLIAKTDYIPNYDSLSLFDFYPTDQILEINSLGNVKTIDKIKFMKRNIKADGTLIEVLNTVITDAKCMNLNESNIYSVYGIGLADPPHEFFGWLSERGDWLWYYYGDQHEVYDQFGNRDSLINIFGKGKLNELDEMTSLLNTVK